MSCLGEQPVREYRSWRWYHKIPLGLPVVGMIFGIIWGFIELVSRYPYLMALVFIFALMLVLAYGIGHTILWD